LAAGYSVICSPTVATEGCPRTFGASLADGATKRRLEDRRSVHAICAAAGVLATAHLGSSVFALVRDPAQDAAVPVA
jgi:hypothetical protein